MRSAALPVARHEPVVHAMQAAALPYIVRELTISDDTLKVPVHVDIHGFTLSVKIIVPSIMPVPERTCPTISLPDVTDVTVKAVPEVLATTVPMAL